MNERIKQLAEQASDKWLGGEFFDREKFAQLIVKECLEQVWYTSEDNINGNISEVIKDRIKQRFGVEE